MANEIGFDPVAWSIDGGKHPGELLRVFAYAATAGSEGIISLGDCKVHQLATAGAGINIDPGAILVRNRSANVSNQTYVANARTLSRLDAPAAVAQARSHLVIVRIKDKQYSPWSLPAGADPATYQYVEPIIIQNVPAGTTDARQLNLGYSAYALARIDLPANTTTILDSHIVNLRKVALPRTKRFVDTVYPGVEPYRLLADPNVRKHFPLVVLPVDCPEWASRLQMTAHYTGLFTEGSTYARTRGEYGWAPGDLPGENNIGDNVPCLSTEFTGIHNSVVTGERISVTVAGDVFVPPAYRGKMHYFRTGTLFHTTHTPGGVLQTDEWTTVAVDLQFEEAAS